MSGSLKDQSARTRIVTDLERSLLVEAGAGSGKTHEMAARMAAGVASGVYHLEHMAAVTFTRKAAAELRGRFHLALEAELKAASDPARVSRIQGAVSNLERFFAGTIHAFCGRLLRERPIEAHVSPGFTELDEVEDKLLRRQSWRDYRSQARAAGDKDLALLAEAGIHAQDLDKAFETICLYEDVEFPADDVPPPDGTKAWKALEKFWAEIAQYLPDPVSEKTKCDTQKAAVQFRRDWRLAIGSRRTPARLADLLDVWDFEPGITQKWWSDDAVTKKKLNGLIPPLHEAFRMEVVEPWLTEWRRHLYAPCVRVLCKARDYASDERRRRNALSFNDLLLLTARVLREDNTVRAALQQKYRYLFVDEFQDTDPIQAEIMRMLQAPGGSLFVVGDPKQSIYRFRRADISIYNEVRQHLAGADGQGIVALTTNFRSVPGVCTWANRVFENVFPAVPDTWQPRFAPLDSNPSPSLRAGRSTSLGPAVCTLTIPATVDSADVIHEEAGRIARFIRSEVQAGRRGYEDFLILTRKKKRLQPYAQALEALQIPIEVSGAGGFGESAEVRALAQLLLALADPQDAVALVGVLRGPLFGCSDVQLFAYRQAGGYLDLFNELPGAAGSAQPVAKALDSLRRWHKWTRMLPAAAALERVLEDSGCLALAAASPGGVEAGDLLHALDRVRAAVEVGFTLAEAAETLTEEDLESNDVESLPLEPGRRDVVRLMNLHKAKGLEASVVFLADALGGFKPRVDVHVVRNEKPGLPNGAGAGRPAAAGYLPIVKPVGDFGSEVLAEPPDWPAHEAAEQRFLDTEVNRLLYVAATRAKDTLVVGRWARSGSPNRRAWAAFDPYLDGVPELAVPDTVTMTAPPVVDLSTKAARAAEKEAEVAHGLVSRSSWSATSVTAEIKHLPRIAVTEDDGAADDPTRVLTAETPSRRADAGQAWGTLVHGLLEHAVRHKTATSEDLRRLALWLTVEEPHLRGVIDHAVETALAVVASESLAAARAATESQTEVPFATRVARDGLPTVVTGAIDLVHRTTDGWRVVDYKTDTDAAGAAVSPAYAAQVRTYAEAWGKVSGDKVKSEIVSARG